MDTSNINKWLNFHFGIWNSLAFIGIVSNEWLCYNILFGSIDRKLSQNQPQITHLENSEMMVFCTLELDTGVIKY